MIEYKLNKETLDKFMDAIRSKDYKCVDEIFKENSWIMGWQFESYKKILYKKQKNGCMVLKGHKLLDQPSYDVIAILQLIHPDSGPYTHERNPIIQMLDLVLDIEDGNIRDENGSKILTETNTQFHLHAVRDLTKELKEIATYYDFCEMPDKQGIYKYNDPMRAYIEICSYEKVIRDAIQRNKMLLRTE